MIGDKLTQARFRQGEELRVVGRHEALFASCPCSSCGDVACETARQLIHDVFFPFTALVIIFLAGSVWSDGAVHFHHVLGGIAMEDAAEANGWNTWQ
jgi:hypothetical protein